MAAQTVTDSTFASTVEGASGPVIVDFWAPWCGPCRQLAPVMDALAADGAPVVKCNTDENPVTAGRYGITALPTIAVFQDGRVVKQLTGAQPKAKLLRELADFLQ